MGYVQPTAMGAKGAAGSKHTPGMIDKVFNTTFGIVQQPLWRIWRALKEDDIDVLSQQGILDRALLPILGFAFDNKNTVMADELFGDNLGAQIAGSILTDPLSFMTGGATAAAKAAKAAQKGLVGGAKKKGVKAMANDTTEAFHRAANYGAGRLDDVGQVLNPGKGMVALSANTKVSEMLSGINHAKKNGGFLDEAGRMLGKSLTPGELNDLTNLGNKLGGLSDDLLGGSLDNLLAQSKKREMGLGLPLLGDFFGMYVAPPKWLSKHGGWMNWYMNTVKEVYAKPARLTGKMIDPVMRMSPFLARQADKTKQVVQQFGKGVKEGPISKAVLNYLQDGASPLVNGSDGALMAASTATKVYNQAYVKAAGGNLALSNHAVPITEHVAKLADDLVGEAATNKLTFNQQVQRRFGEDAAKNLFPGRANEVDSIEAFKANMSSFLYKKEAGAINTQTMTWDDDLMRATTSSEQSLAYRMGRSTRIFYNKMFKNDLGLNGAEELNRFQRRIEAQNSQHQEAMAHRFYSKVEELSEVSGKSIEAVNQIVFARLSLTTSPHEIHAFVDYLNGGGTTTVKQWSKELNEFLGGRVNSNLEYLKGTAAENMRGGTEALDNLLKDLDAGVSKAIHLDELGTGGRAGAMTFEQNLGPIQEMSFSSGSLAGRAITSFEPAQLFGGTSKALNKVEVDKPAAQAEGIFGGLRRDLEELDAKLADPDHQHRDELLDQKAYLEGDIAVLVRWRGQVEDLKDFKVRRPELTGVMNPMGELVEQRLRPTVFKKVNYLGEFKDGTKVTLNNIGKAFGDAPEDITGLANIISRLRTRQAALDKYSDLQGNLLDNTPQNIPRAFIEGFEEDLVLMDGLMRDALIKPLSVGKDGASHKVAEELFELLDSQRDATRLIALQNNIVPHSATPLGYMPRILSGTEFNVVHKALNDFVGDSEGLKDLISPTLAATRQARSFSIQDINHLETVLKKLPENTQGLDNMVERVTDMRVKLTGSADFKKYTEDPAAALVAHHAQMSKALQDQKWFEFIGEQGGKYGIQQGRVVDVILGTPKSVPLVRGTRPALREQKVTVPTTERTGKLTPISVSDYTPPSTARTTWAQSDNSAAELLGGVRVSNSGKTDFEMLMPDNYWVRDGHEAVEGAYEAKGALRYMYDKGLLNETGVLMMREAIRQNPALMRNLKNTTFIERSAALMETMTALGASKQVAQTTQARHMLASIGMATMRGMDEMNELDSARASFIRENGEQGFIDWAMKNFSASSSQARAAMRNHEHFAGMVTASALTKVGKEGLEQAGLGNFVKSFQRQMKQILSRVIATFTGGKKGFMDHKMHSELATQLEQTVKGALNLSDSAADAVLNTQARRGVIDFISSSYHNALKPMVDARMRALGIADGFAPFAARTADDRADMLLHALDYRNVAATLGVKGLKELEKYLDQASTMPRFSYEDGSHLAGLSKQTEWSDEATTTMEDVLEEVKISSRSSASAEGVEGSVSYFDWLDSMTESLSGRNVRQQIEAADPDALKRLNINPFDPTRGNLAETDQLDFLLPGMSPTELEAAGLNAKWVDGGLSFEKSVIPVPSTTVPMHFTDGTVWKGVKHQMMGRHKGKSTLDLIKSGARTATTRKGNPNVKVGQRITFQNKSGESVLVEVTSAPKEVTGIDQRAWSAKEGWNKATHANYNKPGFYQYEYKLVDEAATSTGGVRIISGGQTGADRQALEWAKGRGLETGGTAPAGFYTEAGADPSLKELFGLEEVDELTTSAYKGREKFYGPRTEQNVLRSDVTVIFGDASSAGSKLTIAMARRLKKPVIVNPTAAQLKEFAATNKAKVINVAGNRGSKIGAHYPEGIGSILDEGLGDVLAPAVIRPNRASLPMNPLTKIRAVMASFDDKLDKLAKEQRPDMTIPTTKPRRVQVGDEGSPGTWKITRKTEESTELRVDPKYWRWEEGAGHAPGKYRFDYEAYNRKERMHPNYTLNPQQLLPGQRGSLGGRMQKGYPQYMSPEEAEAYGLPHTVAPGSEPGMGDWPTLGTPPQRHPAKTKTLKEAIEEGGGFKHNIDAEGTLTGTGLEGRARVVGKGGRKSTARFQDADGKWHDAAFHIDDFGEIVWAPNVGETAGLTWGKSARGNDFPPFWGTEKVSAGDDVSRHWSFNYDTGKYEGRVQFEGRMVDGNWVDDIHPFRMEEVPLNQEQLDHIENVITPNINSHVKAMEDTMAKRAAYLKKVEARVEEARKIVEKRIAKQYQKQTIQEFDTNIKILDAVIDDLTLSPQISARQDAVDFVAHAKLNHKDIQRISNELIGEGVGMTKAEITAFQTRLYRQLGSKNEALDAANTRHGGGELRQGELFGDADTFTTKELAFMDEVSSNPALLRMVDEGRLSTTAAFPTGTKYAAKHATRLKELKAIRSDTAAHKALFEKNFTVDRFLEEADNIGSARVGAEDTPFQPVADIIEEGRQKISDLRGGIPKTGQGVADEFSVTGEFFRKTRQAQKATAAATNKLLNKYPDLANLSRKRADVLEEGASSSVTPYSFAENGNMPPRAGEVPPTAPLLPPKSLSQPAGAGWRKGKPGTDRRVMLETDEVGRIKEHVPYMVVIEKADGTRVKVPSTLFDVPEYSMVSLGHGRDIGAALRDSSRRGGRAILKGTNADASTVSQMMGHQVSIGPQGVNGAIQGQLKTQTPGKMAAALKWYDNIHKLMKYMATSLRLPLDFHTANIVSSIPQALMEDIGPTNMIQGMLATGRLFGKDADEILGMAKASAVIQGGKINPAAKKQPFSKIFTVLHDIGERGRFKAGSTRGSAEIAEGSEALIYRGGGNAHHYDDIIAAMVEEGAFDTMVRADFVQMNNADTAVEHIRNMYAGRRTSGFSKAWEAKDRFAELSELFVRMSAMHGAINAGMDLRTAAKSVSRAMVDYSDITQIEKAGLKRLGFFYTFPRKMIPKSLEYLFNNPSKGGALLNHLIKDKEHVKTSEGRVEIAIGDKRVNVGRLAPQIDSMVALASIADTFLPVLGNMIPYGDPRPRRMTGEAAPDKPISPSGILNIAGWEQFLPTEDPLSGSMDWLEEASRTNWAIKMLTGEANLLGSRDPEVEYSPLEALARTVTPYRKVRPAQEEQQMIRRINSHKRRYKRELEEATTAGNVTAIEAYTEYIEQMDKRVTELQRVVDAAAVRPPNPYAK